MVVPAVGAAGVAGVVTAGGVWEVQPAQRTATRIINPVRERDNLMILVFLSDDDKDPRVFSQLVAVTLSLWKQRTVKAFSHTRSRSPAR